jgi:hypothetical protein
MVAESHHSDEEQDPDPHRSETSNQDSKKSEKEGSGLAFK